MLRKTTRGAQGGGTIRQRKDDKWEARYTIGRDPGSGKQIRKSIYADTQKEVRKQLNAITKDLGDGTYSEPSKLTVSQWLDIWVAEYVKDAVKPFTYSSYETQCRIHIKPALGAVKLPAINTHTIQAFYDKLHRGDGSAKCYPPRPLEMFMACCIRL